MLTQTLGERCTIGWFRPLGKELYSVFYFFWFLVEVGSSSALFFIYSQQFLSLSLSQDLYNATFNATTSPGILEPYYSDIGLSFALQKGLTA